MPAPPPAGRPPLARAVADRRLRALEPAAARPCRPHLPGRVLRAARLRDLERHLVRRALPALLQRAVPAARRAAVAGVGRGRVGRRERAWLFDGLVRARWGEPARWAGLWFAALGAVALLANGWLVFALGTAFALGVAARAADSARNGWRVALAVGAALSSPVAAVVPGAGVRWSGASARRAGGAAAIAVAALVPLAVLGPAVPGGRRVPVLVLGLVAAGAVLRARAARDPRHRGASATCARWWSPYLGARDARGRGAQPARRQHDAARLAVRRPGAARAPARARAAAAARAGRRWPRCSWASPGRWSRPVRQTSESLGDPSTERSYYEPLKAWLAAHGAERDRIEIPQTFNHWETAYVSPRLLARTGMAAPARPRAQQALLRRPRADPRALPAMALRRTGSAGSPPRTRGSTTRPWTRTAWCARSPPYLRLRARLEHWACTRWSARPGLVAPRGRGRREPDGARAGVVHARASRRPGAFEVRVRSSPTGTVERGTACVGEAGDWTLVRGRPARASCGCRCGFQPGLRRARRWRASGAAERRTFSQHALCRDRLGRVVG